MAEQKTLDFKTGKVIGGRWKIIKKLGEGGMGAVYKVEDKKKKNHYAAMKIEDDSIEGGVLKLEVHVLQLLQKADHVIKLIDSGKREKYTFMVMSMCGDDLMSLKRKAGGKFSENTTLRIGISSLYAIKQLHEVGFVHRDIKPGNCMTGYLGREARMVYLIDYGMVRAFTANDEKGKVCLRKARDGDQLFRGTYRYCSLATHYRKEQGRVDDLWSWLFMLIELHAGLPWRADTDEKVIITKKEQTNAELLCKGCPVELQSVHKYLSQVKFEERPDYFGLFSECMAGLKRVKGSFLDRYEWEAEQKQEELETALSISEKTAQSKKPCNRVILARKAYPMASVKYFKENILGM